jgi:hypothetical protein
MPHSNEARTHWVLFLALQSGALLLGLTMIALAAGHRRRWRAGRYWADPELTPAQKAREERERRLRVQGGDGDDPARDSPSV